MVDNKIEDIELYNTEKLFNNLDPDRFVHYLEYWKNKHVENSSVRKLVTGLNALDGAVNGFDGGELIVITGPTGNGKTLFADSLGMRFMRNDKVNVGWLSYEVPTIQMIKKYYESEDKKNLGLYVPLELKTGDFDWLRAKCLEARVKHDCRAIFIDHLHFVVDMNTSINMSLNIGAVMRRIKQEIAVALDMVVFVIAHQGQKKEGEPGIDNIRDSSFIAQEADMVFVVYRTADPVPPEFEENAKIRGYQHSFDQGFAIVKIEKSRRTGVYKKRLKYQKQNYFLEEVL